MMADGAPNGYSIISFDGTRYQLDFKAAARPADYQMRIMMPETVRQGEQPPDVFVNVFNGSERSAVRMRVNGGGWAEMQRTRQPDPLFQQISAVAEQLEKEKKLPYRKPPKPKDCPHLWKAPLPAGGLAPGNHLLEVKTVDMDGREHSGRRVFRVEPAEASASAGGR
jgi:hypothetical protein